MSRTTRERGRAGPVDAGPTCDGAPVPDGAGNQWASVTASPDIQSYRATWGTPGVTVTASPGAVANTTVDGLLSARRAHGQGCVTEGREEYADGYHTGQYAFWTDCGSTGASYLVLAAASDGGNYLVSVTVQAVTDADLAAIDRVLGSFIAEF